MIKLGGILVCTIMLTAAGSRNGRAPTSVTAVRVPNGGFQPQAVTGADGTIHLLYYSGSVPAGDLFYCRADSGELHFSSPIRINSQAGSAVAAGTIRGGQIALGKKGRVHAVWNGSGKAIPSPPAGGSPLLYSRLTDGKFEPQRNLMLVSGVLDGGGTVAADSAGNVYAMWHGAEPASRGEGERRLWMAKSTDDGATFSTDAAVNPNPTGACACCSVKAYAASDGTLFALYRNAENRVNRDMHLLISSDQGTRFRGRNIHPWKVPT